MARIARIRSPVVRARVHSSSSSASDSWWAHRHVGSEASAEARSARPRRGSTRPVLVELRMRDQPAPAGGDDSERHARPPARLDADGRQHRRVRAPLLQPDVEEEVVGAPGRPGGREVGGHRGGADVELLARAQLADVPDARGERIEPGVGAVDVDVAELGRERERELGVRGAGATRLDREGDQRGHGLLWSVEQPLGSPNSADPGIHSTPVGIASRRRCFRWQLGSPNSC